MLQQKVRLVRLGLRLADLALLSVAFPVAYQLRDRMQSNTLPGLYPIASYWPVLVLTLLLWVGVSWATRVYHRSSVRPVATELFRVTRAVVLVAWIMLALGFLTQQIGVSRLFVGIYFSLALALLVVDRIAIRRLARSIGRHGFNTPRFAVVGSSELAREVVRSVTREARSGYEFAGYVVDGPAPAALASGKILGPIEELPRLLRSEVIDEVIFAMPRDRLDAVEEGIRLCQEQGIAARVCLDLLVHGAGNVSVDDSLDLPLLSFTTTPSDAVALAAKRVFDVAMSALVLLLLSPVLLVAALAVALGPRGPVLSRQRRVGMNGREFWLYRFRTRVPSGEASGEAAEHQAGAGSRTVKARVGELTRVGALLQRTSLDGLPQLWNVLRGEMSIVGPHAPSPAEVRGYERWQRRRLSMKPGMTCLAREPAAGEPAATGMQLDLRYIDSWSLWQDLKILVRSIPLVFSGRGMR